MALARRSTPVVTACPLVDGQGAVAPTGGREEDAVAVLFACYFVTVMTVLDGPLTGAVVSEFLEFCFCGEAPGAAPLFAGYIVGGVAGYAAHFLFVGFAGA